MNLVIVDPLLLYVKGGAETNDINLGKALYENGNKVTYIVANKSGIPIFPIPKWGKEVRINTFFPKSNLLNSRTIPGKFTRFLFYLVFTYKIIKKKPIPIKNADVIFLTGRPILTYIKYITKAPVVFSVRGTLGFFNEWVSKKADGLIFWGGCENDNSKSLSIDKPVIKLDPCIDKRYFYPPSNTDRKSDRNQLYDNKCLSIIFVGRLEPIKQLDHLIYAIKNALIKGYNVKVNFVGEGSIKCDLIAMASKLIPGKAIFSGNQPPPVVGEMMRTSDIFMLTSKSENHPIAIKEAIACGLKIISYDIGRVKVIINKWNAGIVVPPDDKESLVYEFCKLLDKIDNENGSNQKSNKYTDTWTDVALKLCYWTTRKLLCSKTYNC